ncbi:hypothetical protein BJX99DRAFT_232714 [Aspergillus californicus]
MDSQDAVAFAKAALVAEQYYYGSTTHFRDLNVRMFDSSIPCCGKRAGLDESSLCCSNCHSWYHIECLGVQERSPDEPFTCDDCKQQNVTTPEPGGLNRESKRRPRAPWQIAVGRLPTSLCVRLAKPSYQRPELQLMQNPIPFALPYPANEVEDVILFNGSFSGVAYRLENAPEGNIASSKYITEPNTKNQV